MTSAPKARPEKRHVVTTRVDHPAVMNQVQYLRQKGCRVMELRVDGNGMLDLGELKSSFGDDRALLSIMRANNETGVIFPLREIWEIVKAKGVVLIQLTVQALSKIRTDVSKLPFDLLIISGHRIYASRGVGSPYGKRGTTTAPFIIGEIGKGGEGVVPKTCLRSL